MEEDERTRIRKRLRKARLNNGLTQLQAAVMSGYSPTAIYCWERGKQVPNLDALMQLCKIYGVTPNDILLEGDDE